MRDDPAPPPRPAAGHRDPPHPDPPARRAPPPRHAADKPAAHDSGPRRRAPRAARTRSRRDPTSPGHRHGPAIHLAPLEQLVAQAQYRRLARERELREQLERYPHRPGAAALRAVLDRPGGAMRTRSPAERALLRLLRRSGISGFETNAAIHGYEVDFLWRELSFALELDGYEAHAGRVAFERDRLKAATLKARGIELMPVTPRQVREDPGGVVHRLRAALAAARDRGPPYQR